MNENNNNPYYTSNEEMTNDSQINVNNGSKGLSIASFVLGLVSLVCCICMGLNILAAILSLIFAVVVLAKKRNGKSFAVAGIILSIISILLSAFVFSQSWFIWRDLPQISDDISYFQSNHDQIVEEYERTGELPKFLEKYDEGEFGEFFDKIYDDGFKEYFDEMIKSK